MWASKLCSQWTWVLYLILGTTEHRAQWAGIVKIDTSRKEQNTRQLDVLQQRYMLAHPLWKPVSHLQQTGYLLIQDLLMVFTYVSRHQPHYWAEWDFFIELTQQPHLLTSFCRTPRCLLYSARKSGPRLLLFVSNTRSFMLLHYTCYLLILSQNCEISVLAPPFSIL